MDVGTLIKQARLQKGYTQEEVADLVGVKKSAVAKWENGRVSEIKRSNLKRLSEVLGIKHSHLLGDIEENPVALAESLAAIYNERKLRELVSMFSSLDDSKQEQVLNFIRFLSGSKT